MVFDDLDSEELFFERYGVHGWTRLEVIGFIIVQELACFGGVDAEVLELWRETCMEVSGRYVSSKEAALVAMRFLLAEGDDSFAVLLRHRVI